MIQVTQHSYPPDEYTHQEFNNQDFVRLLNADQPNRENKSDEEDGEYGPHDHTNHTHQNDLSNQRVVEDSVVEGDGDRSDLQGELWRIYTYYGMLGSKGHIDEMSNQQLLRLMKDCKILGHGTPLGRAEIDIIFVVEAKGYSTKKKIQKFNFSDFLGALMKIASAFYTDKQQKKTQN